MPVYDLHSAVKKDDLPRVSARLNHRQKAFQAQVNAYDRSGYTPLMHAVSNPKASVAMVQLLLQHGASTQQNSQPFAQEFSVMALALQGGDPHKVKALLEAGADIHYTREGYNALIDAVHGRDVMRDEHLLELLTLLIEKRVALNSVTRYAESGLRVLSRLGRFDAIRLLLNAGADASHLQWTPLMHAVALGSLADVQAQIETGVTLEEIDWWERTAWLFAIQSGEIRNAQLLLERGASRNASGRCGKPALFYAIGSRHAPMLRWLLQIGMDIEQTDQFGAAPLMTAVECGNLQALDILLRAGAEVNRGEEGQTAMSAACERGVAMRLLDAGADPNQLSTEGKRTLLGFDPEPDEDALEAITPHEFIAACSRRFGKRNPEKFTEPFWLGMIRAGINAYQAAQLFSGAAFAEGIKPRKRLFQEGYLPVWCAQRFGQSITFLSDGRIVQIGGEHEDGYDPDFCIYNDVFVHDVAGGISIFGYPEAVFPPTDFHTATLIGEYIYVIGSLGYSGKRSYGTTPVFRLDTRTFRMERVETSGVAPGWIYRHRAVLVSADEIRISAGTIATEPKDEVNEKSYILDTKNRVWRAG